MASLHGPLKSDVGTRILLLEGPQVEAIAGCPALLLLDPANLAIGRRVLPVEDGGRDTLALLYLRHDGRSCLGSS